MDYYDYDKEFLNTFNECYPFETYIIKEPKLIGNLFDDAYLTEIFVPNTKIEPILDDNGNYITSTKINTVEVYVRLRTKAGEIRFGYFDFSPYIREQIQNIFINDFGDYAYECLYVDYEDTEDLERTLNEQKLLITEKYGKCVSKKENRIAKKFKLCFVQQ